jgi:protein phosphatase 2C family protein 2/3
VSPDLTKNSSSGCTANVVLVTPEHIYCANAGDSRSVASISRRVIALSTDHKPND